MISATTLAAFKALKVNPLREEILDHIRMYGINGCIGDDIRSLYDSEVYKDGSLNTRYSELERAGFMFRNGDTRPGSSGRQQLVMRHVRFADEVPIARPGKKHPNPFLAGMIHAAKTMIAAGDYTAAKAALGAEIRRAAKK